MKMFESRREIRRRLFRSPPVPDGGLGFKDGWRSELLKRAGKRGEVGWRREGDGGVKLRGGE